MTSGRRGGRDSAPAPHPARRLVFHELDSSREGLVALEHFYEALYVDEFPDPDERESLVNMRRCLRRKQRGAYGPNNYHIIVASVGEEAVGGAVADYLAEPNVGVIEFLFIRYDRRRHGLGKALLDEVTRRLRLDARARLGKPIAAIVAEMNDPYRRPRTPDNLDPFRRARVWGGWGYGKLDFPYVQPALSATQRPVDHLALLMRPTSRRAPATVDGRWILEIVGQYMRWAMRIRRFASNRQYRAMARYLDAAGRVRWIPLEAYIGRDPARPFDTQAVGPGDPVLPRLVALARREIPAPGRVASLGQFEAAFVPRRGRTYHLWRLCAPGSTRIDGLASFFTFREIGFGGYIVLAGGLRGRKLLDQLVARIEEQMMRDPSRTVGWMIECGDESARAFSRVGFAELPVDYRPPAVGLVADGARCVSGERLRLMYKRFGSRGGEEPPARGAILDGVAAILGGVYEIRSPRRHRCFRRVGDSMSTAIGRRR